MFEVRHNQAGYGSLVPSEKDNFANVDFGFYANDLIHNKDELSKEHEVTTQEQYDSFMKLGDDILAQAEDMDLVAPDDDAAMLYEEAFVHYTVALENTTVDYQNIEDICKQTYCALRASSLYDSTKNSNSRIQETLLDIAKNKLAHIWELIDKNEAESEQTEPQIAAIAGCFEAEIAATVEHKPAKAIELIQSAADVLDFQGSGQVLVDMRDYVGHKKPELTPTDLAGEILQEMSLAA